MDAWLSDSDSDDFLDDDYYYYEEMDEDRAEFEGPDAFDELFEWAYAR